MIKTEILKILNPSTNTEHSLLGTLNKVVSFLLYSRSQTHIWHLQTESYSEHKALGDYYEKIGELLDTFSEQAISICGRPNRIVAMEFKNYDENCICKHLSFLCEQFYDISKELSDYKDLENTCAEIIGLLHKTKYLLTLK